MADVSSLFDGTNPFAAFFLGIVAVVVLIGIAFYVYSALTLQTIAKKTNTENSWLAWIPIANVVLMLNIAKLHWAWVIALLVGVIPFIGGWLVAAGMVYVWWLICLARGKQGWLSILMAIPIANLIVMGYLAWSE